MSENGTSYTELDRSAVLLSTIAYAPASKIADFLRQSMAWNLGDWDLVWGPAEVPGYQIFCVKKKSEDTYALAIRGSVMTFGTNFFIDWLADLDVFHMKSWNNPLVDQSIAISCGARDGLEALMKMKTGALTLHKFLLTAMASPGAKLVITGHSLGGAMTTVFALYVKLLLQSLQLEREVIPISFAAPSVGNAAFAEISNRLLPGARRFYNTLDIVPKAWSYLDEILTLYSQPGPSCPEILKGAIESAHKILSMDDDGYVQPGGGIPLQGELRNSKEFFQEVVEQHRVNNYMVLMDNKPMDMDSQYI